MFLPKKTGFKTKPRFNTRIDPWWILCDEKALSAILIITDRMGRYHSNVIGICRKQV